MKMFKSHLKVVFFSRKALTSELPQAYAMTRADTLRALNLNSKDNF